MTGLQYTLATFNCLHTTPPDANFDDLRRVVSERPAVVCLQEAASHLPTIHRAAASLGYEVVLPDPPMLAPHRRAAFQTPILVRKTGWKQASGARAVLMVDAGQSGLPPARYAVKVNLAREGSVAHPTFRDLVVINTHFDSHVEFRGLPRPLPRVALYKAHMKRLTGYVADRLDRRVVHVAADFNVDAKVDGKCSFFPQRAMASVDCTSNYAQLGFPPGRGTLGKRFVDQEFLRDSQTHHPRFIDQWIVRGLNSDHDALFCTVEVQV